MQGDTLIAWLPDRRLQWPLTKDAFYMLQYLSAVRQACV